ncbi:MAG: MAPEG family protein [Porticoccus sp.]
MNIEIEMLAATAGLLLLMTLIQGTRNVLLLGLSTAAGNQHNIAAWTGWNDRLNRAIDNLKEAIVIFMPLTIAVQLLGLSNETTALGAQIFVAARIVHVIVYTLGVPWIRTVAWTAGVVGIIFAASPLVA